MNSTDFDQFHEVLARLVAATILGAAIGVNRDLHHKPAGLRMLAMVSLGSAMAAILGLELCVRQATIAYDSLSHVFQGILQGIGFLGAGVIIRSQRGNDIHGMTTASSIWLTAVLGATCGLGEWRLAATGFVIAVVVLTVGRRIERAILQNTVPDELEPPQTPPATP